MPTSTPLTQKKPSTQFWLGALLGVGVEFGLGIFTSFFLQIIIIFLTVSMHASDDVIAVIGYAFSLLELIATMIIAHKLLKSKLFTTGIAVGWIGVPVLFATVTLTLVTIFGQK